MIEGFGGGFALMFISFFLFISSLNIAGIIFYPRAKVFNAVVTDSKLLAHWTYDPALYSRIIEREYEEHKNRNTALLIITDGMLIFLALFFIIFIQDGGFETGLTLLGIAILLFFVAKLAPGFIRDRKEKMPPEAWISTKGLVYEGTVYPYSGFLLGITGVSYLERTEPVLIFSFHQLTGAKIYETFKITIPVPKGEEEKAKKIPSQLGF